MQWIMSLSKTAAPSADISTLRLSDISEHFRMTATWDCSIPEGSSNIQIIGLLVMTKCIESRNPRCYLQADFFLRQKMARLLHRSRVIHSVCDSQAVHEIWII